MNWSWLKKIPWMAIAQAAAEAALAKRAEQKAKKAQAAAARVDDQW